MLSKLTNLNKSLNMERICRFAFLIALPTVILLTLHYGTLIYQLQNYKINGLFFLGSDLRSWSMENLYLFQAFTQNF